MRLLAEMANAIDLLVPFAERNPFPYGTPIHQVWDAVAKGARAEAEAANNPPAAKPQEPAND